MVTPNDSLSDADGLMRENQATHLIVVEPRTRRPVGVLSTLDLMRALARLHGCLDKLARRAPSAIAFECPLPFAPRPTAQRRSSPLPSSQLRAVLPVRGRAL